MTELVLPNDTNPLHGLLGGRLMHWMDIAAAMAAHRHARQYVVTASVDHLDFVSSARVGNFVVLRSSINRAFHTSMEVGVKVWTEDYLQNTRTHVSSAYFTFVAVDKSGHPQPVPPVSPETPEEIHRYEGAGRRREHRLAERDLRRATRGAKP
jgi:acyl-CoA hydrolase